MVKATLRSNKPTTPAPVIDVQSDTVEVKSTVGAGNGTGTPEDLTSLLPNGGITAGPDEAGEASQQQEVSTSVTTRPQTSSAVARRSAPASVEGFDGDWGADDVKYPQLKLVQGSGPLSKEYDAGTIIFGEEELFPPASVKADAVKPSLRFVPISITKQWREKLSQDAVGEGLMPRMVSTLAEVEELGGTTRWLGNEMPDNLWQPSARCVLLVEQPPGSGHPGFTLELDGKLYGVAIYYAAGGAFTASAKVIFNTAMTSLLVPVTDGEGKPVVRNGRPVKKPLLWKSFWALSFGKVQAGNFTPWRPAVKLIKEETGPNVRDYCEGLTRNSEAQEAAVAAE